MKVKHDVARTSRSCLCSSSKRFLYDARIDKEYYGKCISLREKLLLRKLFGAVYDDITQMLPGSNAKRKSSENLRLAEDTIEIAKSRLISHALKIVNIDKPAASKILSDCCSCCSYGSTIPLYEHNRKLYRHGVYTSREISGCRVDITKRVGKRQIKRTWSDICTYKFNNSKEKESRSEIKQIVDRNYVTVFDYPFNYKTLREYKTAFFKNYTKDGQMRQFDEITNENLTTFKISAPISRAYKIETGKISFENIANGVNESICIHKQSPAITHRPPYNFIGHPRISLNKLNKYEPNIKYRFEKDATGDTNYKTEKNIKQIAKINDEKYNTSLTGLVLRRCFCILTLKPHHNQLDVITASKIVAKYLRRIRTTLRSQSKSVSEKSKLIKKTNKKNIAKVRLRFRKNLNIVKEKTNNNIPKVEVHLSSYLNLSGRGNKDHSENSLCVGIGNNLLVNKNKLNRNVFHVENTPQTSINSVRQSFGSKKSTSPFAKFPFDAINEAQEIKKLSGERNVSYKFISHCHLDCNPEIDKYGSTCENKKDKNPQGLSYECKPVFNACIPPECLVSTNKIEPNEHQTHDCKKLGACRSELKYTNSITQKHIKHMKTANVQTSLKTQINKISINPKLNEAVHVNSSYSFYEKKSPLLNDAHICQCGRQYRDAGFQTIETHREGKGPRGNHGKTLETDCSYAKNFCIESDAQSCFYKSKLYKMGRNILATVNKVRYTRKGMVSKKIQLKSFHQDDDTMRQDFGFLTDISCTSNKEKMATDFIIKSKRITQRTKSTESFFPLSINKSRRTKIRSYQLAGSEIMKTNFSQNRKIRHTYVPNGLPFGTYGLSYLIHDLSNKYRHGYSPIELLRERAVKCETNFSSFPSIIGATTTTTSDSNYSFPSAKYNKYKQNTSHRVNSIYKSSFYALNINVNNNRTDTIQTKLQRKNRLTEAKIHGVTSETDPLAVRRSQAVRIGSNFSFDVEFSKRAVHARDFISERKQDRGEGLARDIISGKKQDKGAVPASDFISDKKQDRSAASMQTHSNRSVKQGTHTIKNKKGHNAVSQSHADMQHVGINTKRCMCTLKLHKMGRVYREKGVAAKLSQPKPNVLKETGTYTTKENSHNAAVVEVDLEPNECEPGTDPEECLKRLRKRKNKTRAVGGHIAPDQIRGIPSTKASGRKKEKPIMQPNKIKNVSPTVAPGLKKEISSKQACHISSNFSFSIEFVKYEPGEENIAAEEKSKGIYFIKGLNFVKGLFYPIKLNEKCRSTLQNLFCCRKKDSNIQNQNSNKSVQSNVKYRPDDVRKVKEVGRNSKVFIGTEMKSKHMKERFSATNTKKDKKRKKDNEIIKYRLEDLDPYECEPGICIPGECDPNVCFKVIKMRGMGTDVGPKHTKEETTTTYNKKDKKRKPVNKVVKYHLEDLDPYECEPGTCISGECDPNVCFDIIKKRGMRTSIGTGVEPKHSNEGTTTTHNKKGKKLKTIKAKSVGDSGIQGTRALRYHDSQVIPEHYRKPKTGAILKRCFCTAKLHGIELPLALSKSKIVKQKQTKIISKKTKEGHSQTIKPARKFNLLNLEPYECVPGVCVPGKCDPNICYERIKRRQGIKNISTQSNHDSKTVKTGKNIADHDSKSVKAGKHTADHKNKSFKVGKGTSNHDSKSVKAEKHEAAMSETEKLQDGDHASQNLSKSIVRIGSSFKFNVGFSRQISGMDGDGPYKTKPNKKQKSVSGTAVPTNPKTKKQKMVSGTEVTPNPKTKKQKMVSGIEVPPKTKKQKMVPATVVPANQKKNPRTKAKGSKHLQPPAQSQDSQVVRGKTADESSGIGIVLSRCFCTLSLHGKSKKLKATENTTKKK